MPNLSSIQLNHAASGALYFAKGARLLLHPELRKYILIPVLVNCILFFSLTAVFVHYYDTLTHWDGSFLPTWLGFLETALKWMAWFLVSVILVITYAYVFNIITNSIAAPFYGILAQRTEELITGIKSPEEPILQMIARTLLREMQKLFYYALRGIIILLLILLLSTIPGLNTLAPVIGLLWSAWCMTLQYADYAADNNQNHFRLLRKKLRKRIYSSVGFGATVMGCSMIPVINIIAMPVAVIGGTLFWVNELKHLDQK